MGGRRQKNHQNARRKLRRKLEAQGVPAEQIEARVKALSAAQSVARATGRPADPRSVEYLPATVDEAKIEAWWEDNTPDDSRYRPQVVDPLQRGPGRVNGRTAQAARRRKATTAYELSEREQP